STPTCLDPLLRLHVDSSNHGGTSEHSAPTWTARGDDRDRGRGSGCGDRSTAPATERARTARSQARAARRASIARRAGDRGGARALWIAGRGQRDLVTLAYREPARGALGRHPGRDVDDLRRSLRGGDLPRRSERAAADRAG